MSHASPLAAVIDLQEVRARRAERMRAEKARQRASAPALVPVWVYWVPVWPVASAAVRPVALAAVR